MSKFRFQSLAVADSGEYKCCVRDTRYAYQSYNCYVTQLTVLPEMPKLDAGSESVPASTGLPSLKSREDDPSENSYA